MRQYSFENTHTSPGLNDSKAVQRASSPLDEDTKMQGVYVKPLKDKPLRQFTNIKSRLIGLFGAILISYMIYNLLTNYLGLI